MKRIASIIVGALVMGTLATSGFAATTATVADANTRQGAASTNYGTSTYIAVEPGSQLRDGWFKFDTSSIKSGYDAQFGAGKWKVTGVSFVGQSWETWNYKIAGDFSFSYNSDDSWTESGLTWNNQPGTATDQTLVANWYYDAVNSGSPTQRVVDLGATNASLLNDIMGGSLVTIHTTAAGTGQVGWEAKEFAGGAYSALLDVTAEQVVPEPGAILALASGLIGMVGFARRRRN